MKGEVRLTEKQVAAEVLPLIQEAKKLVKAHYESLRYLWVTVDGKPKEQFSVDCFAIYQIRNTIKRVEGQLCQI